jgi:hypothetical protein
MIERSGWGPQVTALAKFGPATGKERRGGKGNVSDSPG